MDKQTHRNLRDDEIRNLQAALCSCSDWNGVYVCDGFNPVDICNCEFEGKVYIGTPENPNCRIRNSRIENCSIGGNCTIRNVGLLSNYDIEDSCSIENCGEIKMRGESSFGNGTTVNVLNEAGGRPIRIFDGLNAQIAYMLCFYFSDPQVSGQLKRLHNKIETLSGKTYNRGKIGRGSKICNSKKITNIKIGENSVIDGCSELENGNLNGTADAPVTIGSDVIAHNFIISKGSYIHSAAIIESCFVGEAVEIGRQFSAEHCLIFCNSQLFHGEACSVFAGPYTVSHHKSTLLIGGMFSFYNAGSGTNQSNHLYKAGPRHSGILERGCKTASSSYLMWPARLGAFSVVLGKHCTHFDTSRLPFSYIVEKNGASFIKPAINLTSYGTARDIAKWEKRDKRSGSKADITSFNVYSSGYILEKLYQALQSLQEIERQGYDREANICLEDGDIQPYKHLYISNKDLQRGKELYSLALNAYSGQILPQQLSETEINDIPAPSEEGPSWIDLGGMFVSKDEFGQCLQALSNMETAANPNPNADISYAKILFKAANNVSNAAEWEKAISKAQADYKTIQALIEKDREAENSDFAKIGFGLDFVDKETDYQAVMDNLNR